jgi:hypothetical protein
VIADKYDIPALKNLAVPKFQNALLNLRGTDPEKWVSTPGSLISYVLVLKSTLTPYFPSGRSFTAEGIETHVRGNPTERSSLKGCRG